METLHRLSFLKITAGQNRWQRRAHQKGRFPPRVCGAAKPPARWTGPTPALSPRALGPGPRAPTAGPLGRGTFRKPQGSAPAVAENFSRRSGGGWCPRLWPQGLWIKCGLHVPRRGGLNRTTSLRLERPHLCDLEPWGGRGEAPLP